MPTVIGLDLGRHTFRAVEIDKTKKGNVVIRSGIYDNPKIDLEDPSKNSLKEYSHSIHDFFKESNFSTSKVVISIEEKDIFMRVITLPSMNDKELKSSIAYESEQYIPLPLKEVSLSYQKLEMPGDNKGKLNVQLVAAKKGVIDKYIGILKDAKLTPIGIEPEALSIGRALSDKSQEEALMILHIGYEKTLIIITYKGSVIFTRTLSIGGDTMTRSISQALGLDYVQAEEYKKAYGLNKDQAEGKIYAVLEPVFGNILAELGRAQVFYTTHNPSVNINRVLLSGGSSMMPGLIFHMAANLSMEVELANPFRNFTFGKDLEAKKDWHIQQGPYFVAPVGLALKE